MARKQVKSESTTVPKSASTKTASESSAKSTKPEETVLNAKDDLLDKGSDDEDYDEEDDDDYDPTKKAEDEAAESEPSDNEPEPDYSAINTGISQVRTRNQRYKGVLDASEASRSVNTLLQDTSSIDVDAIFKSMQKSDSTDWKSLVSEIGPETEKKPVAEAPLVDEKIRIVSTYTFAGKLVRESKIVDANSAEAKAYLNSTKGLIDEDENAPKKGSVTVVRKVAGTDEERELRIKLKRPSLIDKFLAGDNKNKLTTLEKSRLDWASFVDKKSIKDDLALHNKGGYLEKQDFLGRMEAKRDEQYQQARELDRQRQWQQQQKMA